LRENPLAGLRILVMEDEFLIAMDVEEICRDNGASEVVLVRDLDELDVAAREASFDAAILDVMLGGRSTIDFARSLAERGVPFVFATGYSGEDGLFDALQDVEVIEKPYAGEMLLAAITRAIARVRPSVPS
jgi:DNA-binding response OmpR family regulator